MRPRLNVAEDNENLANAKELLVASMRPRLNVAEDTWLDVYVWLSWFKLQ